MYSKLINRPRTFLWPCSLLLISLLFSGCDGESSLSVVEYNKSNIQRLRNAYAMYGVHRGSSPKDEASFKDFLKTDPSAEIKLKRMGVSLDQIDEIFISERDDQAFKIRWGVGGGGKDHAIVFEAKGVDGKRMVAFFEPRELEPEEWERYFSGQAKPEF